MSAAASARGGADQGKVIDRMELELGLAPPNPHQPLATAGAGEFVGVLSASSAGGAGGKKRAFGDASEPAKATLLPLFVPGDDDDGDGGGGGGGGVDHEPSNKKKRLVGWPPVKCARRRSCGGGGGSCYVKVKMEGVAIGRKVDVSLHASYQDLLRTLHRMFPSGGGDHQGAGADHTEEGEEVGSHERRRRRPYVVTYEDGEGDWMLVGDDVPWEVFVKSVKRLKILA